MKSNMPNRRTIPLAIAVAVSALLAAGAAQAEFVLNWSAQNPATAVFNTLNCQTPAACGQASQTGEGGATTGQTPFLYERAALNGVDYYHLIVGRPEDGFAQEVFIQAGTGNTLTQSGRLGLPEASSSSLGDPGDQNGTSSGNGLNPFNDGPPVNPVLTGTPAGSTFSGNASGNPNRVQMRQLMTDGELTVDFVKDIFLDKPSITNTIENDAIRMEFSMDSTGNTYSQSDTPSVLSNTIEHLDPLVPAESAFFDVTVEAQNPHVTAGRYTYTPSASNQLGGAGGTYNYVDGGINENPDWGSFFDPNEANPWTFSDACPVDGACGPNP